MMQVERPVGRAVAVLVALAGLAAGPAVAGEPGAKDERAWDVSDPRGDWGWRDVEIDVTEGTWMSVDVSPDGRTIAFDLLGDIYLLPIEGGEARAITSGVAWDMQPRFSPDGTRIAFTSDRGGGDNIWVMGSDGSEPRAITKETYRLLNGPAWSPDGEWIVARKHFTSRRSLGAGEMWLYHVPSALAPGGGPTDGLPMTDRPTDQKDVNEPAFSPDGRYLYYSWDATPGGRFEYNKDSTGEIYRVSRLDRETGETEAWITGPGGAVRPTPSRDGSRIAFVRRDRFETCLYVQDVKSGEVRKVCGGLERDMQEAWAIHGVYPAMAWLPGDREIVLYAKGRIHRVSVETGEKREIPFRVRDTRRVAGEALRFPVEVAPPEGAADPAFEVRMIRWAEVSPAGDRVVFQALGKLWTRAIRRDGSVGEPERLTDAEDGVMEFCPSFSRDGSRIVYTAWSERELGSVRVVPAGGGTGRKITNEPGVYVDPVFSPDGETVVFGKIGGGWLLGNVWSARTGVFRVPAGGLAEGEEMALVTKDGVAPQFGAASDRVYVVRSAPDKERDNIALVSMTLDGKDERTHLKAANGQEFRVSPDGAWAAWVEGYRVHATPVPSTGRAVEIGPKASSHPVKTVSTEAGGFVRWSADGERLRWTLGPELCEVAVHDAFAWIDGAAPGRRSDAEGEQDAAARGAERATPEPRATHLGFGAPFAVPEGTVAFVGARVLTMDDGSVGGGVGTTIEDGVVVVEGNRIAGVGPRGAVEVPEGAQVVDCSGMVLMPGMVDAHAHGAQGRAGIVPERNWGQYANLAFGVTTIHDPSNDSEEIFSAAEMQRAGLIVAPRIYSTGTILYGASGSFRSAVDSLDDARFHVGRTARQGAISVKSYNQPRRDQRQQIIQAGRELGVMVVPEGGSTFMHNMTMVVDGHTGVEHSLPVERIYDDVRRLWGATATGYTPTLVVGYGGLDAQTYWEQHTDAWENERLTRFVPRAIVDPDTRRRLKAPEEDHNSLRVAGICRDLSDAGVSVHLGAHGQMPGIGAHWELWSIAHGFGGGPEANARALRAATREGAEYLGMGEHIGSVEEGKLADLVVLERDPVADIRGSDSVRYVMVNGRLFDARTMDELNGGRAGGEPFYFKTPMGSLGVSEAYSACGGCGRVGCGPGDDDGVPEPKAYR